MTTITNRWGPSVQRCRRCYWGWMGPADPSLAPLFEGRRDAARRGAIRRRTSGPTHLATPAVDAERAWPSRCTLVSIRASTASSAFSRFDGYDWDVVNRSDVRSSHSGSYSTSTGSRASSSTSQSPIPRVEFDGALLPGYIAPADPACHPEGLLADVRGGHRRLRRVQSTGQTGETDLNEPAAHARRSRGEAFRYLVDRYDPDLVSDHS